MLNHLGLLRLVALEMSITSHANGTLSGALQDLQGLRLILKFGREWPVPSSCCLNFDLDPLGLPHPQSSFG